MNTEKRKLQWKADLPALITEIHNNGLLPNVKEAMTTPINAVLGLLRELTTRAIAIDDIELNKIMLKLGLYENSHSKEASDYIEHGPPIEKQKPLTHEQIFQSYLEDECPLCYKHVDSDSPKSHIESGGKCVAKYFVCSHCYSEYTVGYNRPRQSISSEITLDLFTKVKS